MIEKLSQTDTFAIRPSSPEYVPRKTGVDRFTQVEDVFDLFDFDKEVDPILAVLVSKTIEQAIFEVKGEEELQNLENLCDEYLEKTEEHKFWILEQEESSRLELQNKQLIVEESLRRHQELVRLRKLVAGQEFIHQIFPDILQSITDTLYSLEVGFSIISENHIQRMST